MPSAFLNINKPAGMTSRDVVNRLVRKTGERRAGHCGTLDPFATGVLVVAFGRYTRLVDLVQAQPKTYRAVLRLGTATTTLDLEGEMTETLPVPELPEQKILEVLRAFTGVISQVPPAFSALKVDGRRAYSLAREGKPPELEARQVTIYDLHFEGLNGDELTFTVRCGAGTYVRSLGAGIARALGTVGHLISLERRAIGGFRVEEAHSLEEIEATASPDSLPWIDATGALPGVGRLTLDNEALERLQHGNFIRLDSLTSTEPVPEAGEPVLVQNLSGTCVWLAKVAEKPGVEGTILQPRCLLTENM